MIEVIYEDNHLLGLRKPSGLLVQGDDTGDDTLANQAKFYIKHQYNKPGAVYLGVIHRIDRPVSGTVIFAKTSKALSRMNELMRDREISKVYYAITDRRPYPESARLEHYLIKNRQKNLVKAYDQPKKASRGAKKAVLDYEIVSSFEGRTLLKISLLTGRPHQIRAQLNHISCPILGDVKYGPYRPLDDMSIALHCYSMSFIHPTTKEQVSITSEPPETSWWLQFREFL